ncbi:hypothetical protein N0V84_002545 [Fusarium piperis]|uniref:Aminoglycoside phosphotransferase domain-containing protein n=1 Tax=Fusarium piperis TaxID=1435070 RepID=A0A9W9BS10_9HYPO|nr:hypothetical protein N0V84_002545 [Fusarium piperis]
MASVERRYLVPDDKILSEIFPEKLQRLDLGTICQSLTGTPCVSNNDASQPVKISIGGPELGYFPDVKQFLDGLVQASNQRSPSCKLLEINGGIVLESTYEDIGRTELSRSDLDDLQHHVVFCHNDVEPRNILARKISSPEEKAPRYELVAIIDWETAGFYPFTYEYAHKDTILGSSNLSLSWYTLFKQRTSHMLPPAKCHTNLMRAVKIIDESKKRRMTRNVGIRFQAKWMDMEQMEKSSDPRQGWVRKTGAQVPRRFTKDDKETLELEVLKELDYV